jgi:hypothetical protein
MNLRICRPKTVRSWAFTLIVGAVALSSLVAISPSGADNSTWSPVQPAQIPVGVQGAPAYSFFQSVSCVAAKCVAAGEFYNNTGGYQAATETSSDGAATWAIAQPATIPDGLLSSTNPNSYFSSVSCSGSTCVAAGYFYDTTNVYVSMTDTSSDGGATWSVVQPTVYPPGSEDPSTPYSYLASVSCVALRCTVAGYFRTVAHTWQAMTDTSSNGGVTWAVAQPTNFAAGVSNPSTPNSFLTALSCSGTTCVAAGYFLNAVGSYQAMTVNSSDVGVTWAAAQPTNFVGQPSGPPFSQFLSVSCSGLTCVAAGQFQEVGSDQQAMTATSSDGGVAWSSAQPANFASGVQSGSPDANFQSVSCSGLTCVAAGQFEDANGDAPAMTETSGDGGVTWADAQPAVFASGVQGVSHDASFDAVSCAGSTCVAAGSFTDAQVNSQAMTVASSDGGVTWTKAQPAAFAGGVQNVAPEDEFSSVSCEPATCVAAGQFFNANGNLQAMTQLILPASSSGAVTNLFVTQIGTKLSASWSASTDATNYTCTLLYGFTTPSTFTSTVTGTSCSFTGLSATTPYGVAVVANGPGGSSDSVSAFGTPSPTTTTTIHTTPRPVVRTIVCVHEKKIKRVRGVHPRCPAGYKKK